jgi:hypothetical protein
MFAGRIESSQWDQSVPGELWERANGSDNWVLTPKVLQFLPKLVSRVVIRGLPRGSTRAPPRPVVPLVECVPLREALCLRS